MRHFQQYFPPVLCYLEGTWIKESDKIEEPFASDRHFIDAKTWRELYDKNRYILQSGRKSSAENLPFLPMAYVACCQAEQMRVTSFLRSGARI